MPDSSVLLFTVAVSLATGLLFGVAPAFAAARTGAASSLSSNARVAQGSGDRSSHFWPKTLVTVQVMLSLVLLVGAGLFLRTLQNLQNQDYGFERTHLLLAQFNPKLAGYQPSQAPALNQRLLDRLNALPGVRSAALSNNAPISNNVWGSSIAIPGYTPAPKEDMDITLNRVTGRYFETVGIPIVAGRAITPDDSATSLKVVVVNQTLVRRFFPKGDPVGRTFNIVGIPGAVQIVGVARDIKSESPRDEVVYPMVYLPLAQMAPMEINDSGPVPVPNQNQFVSIMELRTTGDPAQSIRELRSAVASIDPNLPITSVHTIQEQVDSMMTHETLISRLTGIFSLLALVLASIGLYGVMSYNVVRRTNEIGIRLALGAQTRTVLWMVLRESLRLLVIGVALGLPLTLLAVRVIQGQLFGLSALDPLTFAGAIVVVCGMTLLAAWLPARRATRVDPMVALRCD